MRPLIFFSPPLFFIFVRKTYCEQLSKLGRIRRNEAMRFSQSREVGHQGSHAYCHSTALSEKTTLKNSKTLESCYMAF